MHISHLSSYQRPRSKVIKDVRLCDESWCILKVLNSKIQTKMQSFPIGKDIYHLVSDELSRVEGSVRYVDVG